MPNHKFHVGEIVELAPSVTRNAPRGIYVVTRPLPESAGEYKYRIKSINEPHERVALESELAKA